MVDREKVIDGLCGAIGLIHGYIPKRLWVDGYEEQACRDAIDLLKEQEPDDPVKLPPHRGFPDGAWDWGCPKCNYQIGYGWNFCPRCGQAVNWDD